jgi:ribose transport system ATP-binding protein
MVARDIKDMFPKRLVQPGAAVLDVRNMTATGVFEDVSLTVHQSEIVGITGLIGSGAKELLQTVFGLRAADSGDVVICGSRATIDTPARAVARGVAFVPEDRRAHGVALSLSVRENISLASLARYGTAGFVGTRRERAGVDALIRELGIRTAGREAPVRRLSGGNQQKVVLAKWLSRESSVYVLDEPTVGVDVGAKVEIYRLLSRLAENGAGILVLSTDLIELMGICDRIVVLYRGRVVAALRTLETNTDDVLKWATGAQTAVLPNASTTMAPV